VYTIDVNGLSAFPDLTVLGNPLTVNISAGLASVNNSNATFTVPDSLVVGSTVTAHISLNDQYGNPITEPAQRYNSSFLVIEGTTGGGWGHANARGALVRAACS
jgi:hypothetical protein